MGFLKLRGLVDTGFAHARKYHAQRAQQVKMSKRIQRKAAFALGGGVPQQPGSQRMAGFMERDGHQCHQRADEIIGCPCHKHLLKNNIFYYNTIFWPVEQPLLQKIGKR